MLYRGIYLEIPKEKWAQNKIITALEALVFLCILAFSNPMLHQIPVLWTKDLTDRIYGADPTKTSNWSLENPALLLQYPFKP